MPMRRPEPYVLLGFVGDVPSRRQAIIEWGRYSFALDYITGVDGDQYGIDVVHFIGGAIKVIDGRRR